MSYVFSATSLSYPWVFSFTTHICSTRKSWCFHFQRVLRIQSLSTTSTVPSPTYSIWITVIISKVVFLLTLLLISSLFTIQQPEKVFTNSSHSSSLLHSKPSNTVYFIDSKISLALQWLKKSCSISEHEFHQPNLPQLPPLYSFLCLLQSRWPPRWSWDIPTHPHHCTFCSLSLESSFAGKSTPCFPTSFKSLLKYLFIRKGFPNHPVGAAHPIFFFPRLSAKWMNEYSSSNAIIPLE